MIREPSALQGEIRQKRRFRTPSEEAMIGILRTADVLRRRMSAVVEPHGITLQQYNVLRILRGAVEPLPTLEIGERMVEQTPGVTRLLDRIEARGLVRRERCTEDRRQVLCTITPAGLELLAEMDDAVDAADDSALQMLSRAEQEELIGLLDRIRAG